MTYSNIAKIKSMCLRNKVKSSIAKQAEDQYSIVMSYKGSAATFFTTSYERACAWLEENTTTLPEWDVLQKNPNY